MSGQGERPDLTIASLSDSPARSDQEIAELHLVAFRNPRGDGGSALVDFRLDEMGRRIGELKKKLDKLNDKQDKLNDIVIETQTTVRVASTIVVLLLVAIVVGVYFPGAVSP